MQKFDDTVLKSNPMAWKDAYKALAQIKPNEAALKEGIRTRPNTGNQIKFQEKILMSANFADQILLNIDASYANFSYANFSDAVLGGNYNFADFSYANLLNAHVRGAAKGSNFSNANLNGADLSNADLRGADFSNADLTSAILPRAMVGLSGANFSNANLTNATHDDDVPVTRAWLEKVTATWDKRLPPRGIE